MEIIFELVFQLLFEVIGELLFEAGFKGGARVLRSAAGRFAIASAAGFGAGFWWGARLSETGRVEEPRTLWVSLGFAVVAGLAALWRWRRPPADEAPVLSPPWRWPATRWVGFAVLNAAIAAGVAVGFDPQPVIA